jgi:hypothetical protein
LISNSAAKLWCAHVLALLKARYAPSSIVISVV